MANEWAKLCRATDFSVEKDSVLVKLADQRQHRVFVWDGGETYELVSVVAKPGHLEEFEDVSLLAWRRNRSSQMVGFRVDERGRLVGETWVPKNGLEAEEFQTCVRRLATDCDRFEYLLTGADAH